MGFISISEVRKRFKKEGSYFQKGYFDAFNNPQRTAKEIFVKRERINQLLIDGRLDKKTADFFNGQLKGLNDRQNI